MSKRKKSESSVGMWTSGKSYPMYQSSINQALAALQQVLPSQHITSAEKIEGDGISQCYIPEAAAQYIHQLQSDLMQVISSQVNSGMGSGMMFSTPSFSKPSFTTHRGSSEAGIALDSQIPAGHHNLRPRKIPCSYLELHLQKPIQGCSPEEQEGLFKGLEDILPLSALLPPHPVIEKILHE
ncbi:unnamed protein product [Darwinula stevensoni]|uniref:Uncharacterized protein n=1 Tax=Darwinula stevensoni TaxID=69355 RepID=A0A7R9FSI6_9CRUS|nr:unnamed protein product [Darwinula stevensoni]CAG0903569.1 unnamed protein product [Darwinula stevensoni]